MLPRFQEVVLRAVYQRGPDCRVSEVQAVATALLKREQAFGAIFTTMDRLSARGFVTWKKGEPESRRGGRAPRLYTITGEGISALSEARRLSNALHGDREEQPGAVPVPSAMGA